MKTLITTAMAVVSAAAILNHPSLAQEGSFVWDQGAATDAFREAGNWNPDGVTFSADEQFTIGDGSAVHFRGTAETGAVAVGGNDGELVIEKDSTLTLTRLSFVDAPATLTVNGTLDALARFDLRGRGGALQIEINGHFLNENDNNQITPGSDVRIDVKRGGFYEFGGGTFGSIKGNPARVHRMTVEAGGAVRLYGDLTLQAAEPHTTSIRLNGGEFHFGASRFLYADLNLDHPGNGVVVEDAASILFLEGDRVEEVKSWIQDGALSSTVGELDVEFLSHDNTTVVRPSARRQSTVFHVSTEGSNDNPGSKSDPFLTIQHAADLAQPGDRILVAPGIYRERIDPPRGGLSEAERIVFEAAQPGEVTIKGSDPVTGWSKVEGDIWEASVDNALFGNFNPFAIELTGDWFNGRGRIHHLGVLYFNDVAMVEAETVDEVGELVEGFPQFFATVEEGQTTFRAHFPDGDPNAANVEATTREAVFYPSRPGVDWITVKGFNLRNSATPWAPPTAEQVGLIGTHWGKGWIIENNRISGSRCTGITLGKYGDRWDNKSESAEAYVDTINRALEVGGWNRANVGSHVVRNNVIHDCEQAGIVGSMGGAFSLIENNVIYNMNRVRAFAGMEMAGIKLHGGIDVIIRDNLIYEVPWGIWLDWMSQGARVSRNVLHSNGPFADLYLEVNHGPLVVDNNFLLSEWSFRCISQGNALAHNLLAGRVTLGKHQTNPRKTPYHACHATEVRGLHDNPRGDDHWFHNVLATAETDLEIYNTALLDVTMEGNVFLNGAKPSEHSKAPTIVEGETLFNIRFEGEGRDHVVYLEIDPGKLDDGVKRRLVESGMLGKAEISGCPYENADGSPVAIDYDAFNAKRDVDNPLPGPLSRPRATGTTSFEIWPKSF